MLRVVVSHVPLAPRWEGIYMINEQIRLIPSTILCHPRGWYLLAGNHE